MPLYLLFFVAGSLLLLRPVAAFCRQNRSLSAEVSAMPVQSFIFARPMEYFENKVVWITGASSGIGLEAVRHLDKCGALMVISARRVDVLEGVRDALEKPENVMVVPIDLEHQETFSDAARQVIERFGRIDILINNAGISQRSYVVDTDLGVDKRIMEVNYFGTVALTKAVLPYMLNAGGGHFVTVTSLVGKFGFGVRSAYAASKHALHGFFESLHIELHERGIRVTIVCPGPVQTSISLNALDGSGTPTGEMDDMQKKGMPAAQAVRIMLRGVSRGQREIIIGNFKEKLGVRLKAWLPSVFFKMALKQNPRGEVKLR